MIRKCRNMMLHHERNCLTLEQNSFMECYGDDVVTTPGITILSPNYPYNYPTFCDSQLTINFDGRISLYFESFDVEYLDDNCVLDWLEIRDGKSVDDDRIGAKLCGSNIPGLITSTGKYLKLIFHSDDSNNYKGFKIQAQLGK